MFCVGVLCYVMLCCAVPRRAGVWDLVAGVPDSHDNNFSAGDATPDGSTIYLATSSGLFTQLDTRANSASTSTSTQQQLMIANRCVCCGVCPVLCT